MPRAFYFMISSTMNALQFSDYRFQLLTQSDGIALRKEYHSIEGIRDGEDRQQVLVLKLHVLYHSLRQEPSLSIPKMMFFGKPGNSDILNFLAEASSSNRRTIGRFHLSNTCATLAMSFKAWLVGSCPTPINPITK